MVKTCDRVGILTLLAHSEAFRIFNVKSITWTTVNKDCLYWFVPRCRKIPFIRIGNLQRLSNIIHMHKVCYEML